jgi:hypothetical protein
MLGKGRPLTSETVASDGFSLPVAYFNTCVLSPGAKNDSISWLDVCKARLSFFIFQVKCFALLYFLMKKAFVAMRHLYL